MSDNYGISQVNIKLDEKVNHSINSDNLKNKLEKIFNLNKNLKNLK